MAKSINPIRKLRVKKDLLKGIDAKHAMINAGYSPNTAHKSTSNAVVKVCQAEIEQDIKKQITVEFVLNKLKWESEHAKNAADRIRATELMGKWQAMFTDKVKSDIDLREEEIPERRSRLLDMIKDTVPHE